MILLYFVIVIAIIFFPLRFAAQFSDAENTSYLQTLIVAIAVAVSQTILAGIVFAPLIGTLISIIVTVMIGMKLFDIPSSNFLKFGALFFAMSYLAQIVAAIILSALFS